MKGLLLYLFLGFTFAACTVCTEPVPASEVPQELRIPAEPYNYQQLAFHEAYQDNFTQVQDNESAENVISNWGATLGRVLFYDKKLSKNNRISCASCHIQAHGFSDTARFSTGFEGGKTTRHSMSLINARYYASGRFFWDERAATLEEQVLMPIQDKVEMGMPLDSLELKLAKTSYYPWLFKKAFGSDSIHATLIAKALAQFVRSIVSSDTKYHAAKGNRDPKSPFPGFTFQENLGKEIFFGSKKVNCSSCHITNAFVAANPRNNGVRNGDFGTYQTSGNPQDVGAFKSTTLVDIASRGPYMHDGSMATLEEVIEHYNSGLTNGDGNLDRHIVDENGEGFKMNMNKEEKEALLAFLKTLSSENIRSHEAYSNPFITTN
ncbi:cytochrome-c peroxidase [Luteibaculum oceani]|uniref:Cytochrome-c peroxidase n=1 Tax=Luteibaculum oceani TaxID=1294296 RepID=A0A5C6UY53_9FLAO|nr:cytochrome c peroxidase [Luteibaculum oceani]TXC76986.1 cytochrome-c peroxidase [Luteibaculum oceani]